MVAEFPDDDNGDALRNMAMSGDDLTKERFVDFSVILPSEQDALEFCLVISECGWRLDCRASDDHPELWDVTVTSNMIPTHEAISHMEEELEAKAAVFKGRMDGWGCFAVAEK